VDQLLPPVPLPPVHWIERYAAAQGNGNGNGHTPVPGAGEAFLRRLRRFVPKRTSSS
jgi:hypothetical protein